MDYLDLMHANADEVMSGTYYRTKKADALLFTYEYIDQPKRTYGAIINNLLKDPSVTIVRTSTDCEWRNNGFVVLQNDVYYTIRAVHKIVQDSNREVLRVLKTSPAESCMLELVETENPMGLK